MPIIWKYTEPLTVDQSRYNVLIQRNGYFAERTVPSWLSPADKAANPNEVKYKLDSSVVYRGVNLSGAEFGVWNGAASTWRWPLEQEWQYLSQRGHGVVRLPYLWERVQSDLTKPNDSAAMTALDRQIGWAAKYGIKVILDLHNYASYKGNLLGSVAGPTEAQFNAHWVEISKRYRYNDAVIGYGLMNEPKDMPTRDVGDGRGSQTGRYRWYSWAQSTVNAIRALGDKTPIMVAGYASSVVQSWLSTNTDVTNRDIHRFVTDPIDNLYFEGHSYWGGGGTYSSSYATYNTASGQSDTPAVDGITRFELSQLRAWLDWAQEAGVKVFLGEVGWPRIATGTDATSSAKWNTLGEEYYRLLDAYGVWAAAWSAGSKWSAGYNLKMYAATGDVLNGLYENAATVEAHPTFRRVVTSTGMRPMTAVRQGLQWRGQNVPLELCNSSSIMVSGTEFGTTIPIETPGHISRMVIYLGTVAAGNTAGQCFAAFYDAITGEELCRSADLGTLLNSGTGFKNIEMLTRTRTFKSGELVAAKLLWNGTTPPTILRAPASSVSVNPRKFGTVSTGATALSATLNVATMTAPTQAFWVAAAGF
jgi:endoglucanase